MPEGVLLFSLAAATIVAACVWWPLRAFARAGETTARAGGPLAVAACAGVAVFGLYLIVGSPGLADAPYAARMAALRERAPETLSAEEAVAVLAAAARRHPDDAQPLIYLGEIEANEGRLEPALRAFEEALRRDPNSAIAMLGLARVLYASQRGVIGEDARALFEAAAQRAPTMWEPYFYQALAARQDGRQADARRFWEATLARLPADDPRREMVRRMLAES